MRGQPAIAASAMISPPPMSRFARIRAVSTSSPPASAGVREGTRGQQERLGNHHPFDRHRGVPRSCSCTWLSIICPTSQRNRVAMAMICGQATGLRFCGIADDPPRPAS
jgi:hypothetical protein